MDTFPCIYPHAELFYIHSSLFQLVQNNRQDTVDDIRISLIFDRDFPTNSDHQDMMDKLQKANKKQKHLFINKFSDDKCE